MTFHLSKLSQSVVSTSRRFASSTTASFKNIVVERKGTSSDVGLIHLGRTKSMNLLSQDVINELNAALKELDQDPKIGAMVITGSERAFATGADIKEMHDFTFQHVTKTNYLGNINGISRIRKPIIAAVNGFALGGGCELAMLCDIIYAGEKAHFGLPEILLGTIPGAGGTQRLIRAIGKSKAMEMILTGERINVKQAEHAGLVAKVFPVDKLVDESIKVAERIAKMSRLAISFAKEAINKAEQLPLDEGVHFESRLFHATFATEDRKEGMAAFIEKRHPKFTNN